MKHSVHAIMIAKEILELEAHVMSNGASLREQDHHAREVRRLALELATLVSNTGARPA